MNQSKFLEDMSMHFGQRLNRLVCDVGDTCGNGGMEEEHLLKMIITGLLYEAIIAAGFLRCDEDSFVHVCRMAHQQMRERVTELTNSASSPSQVG